MGPTTHARVAARKKRTKRHLRLSHRPRPPKRVNPSRRRKKPKPSNRQLLTNERAAQEPPTENEPASFRFSLAWFFSGALLDLHSRHSFCASRQARPSRLGSFHGLERGSFRGGM